MTEPAVVHNEQFDSQLLSFLGIADEGLLVKIKARALPAVDKKRTFFIFPFSSDEIVVVKIVECAAHFAHAAVGINHYDLRALELIAGFNDPCEINRVDTHYKACAVKIIRLDISGEVTAVYKVKTESITEILAALIINKCNKRIVVMA